MVAIEILGDTVKDAIGASLYKEFPSVRWFTDNPPFGVITQYPHFFIEQVELSSDEDIRGTYFLTYIFAVRYVHSSRLDEINNSLLDGVGLRVMGALSDINIGRNICKTDELSIAKVDSVLTCTGIVKFLVTKKLDGEMIAMRDLTINSGLKGE